MPWTDPTAAIGVDKPIRASTHLGIFFNFAALANGDPGAPRVRIPQAVRTDETDAAKVLQPDGAGGVRWGSGPVIAGGRHIDYNGGSPTTNVPAEPAIYVIHGRAQNTSTHIIALPTPSAAVAGHIVLIAIEQTGSFGRTNIGGLASVRNGESWSGVLACDGQHWALIAAEHVVPDDD